MLPCLAMNGPVREKHVFIAVLVAFVLYAAFAQGTMSAEFKPRARYMDAWMLARYLVFTSWILLAYLIYKFRKGSAELVNLRRAALSAGVISFGLAIVFGISMFGLPMLGSALTYTIISAFLCFTIKHRFLNPALALVLVLVQIVVDAVAFWQAGQYRIH